MTPKTAYFDLFLSIRFEYGLDKVFLRLNLWLIRYVLTHFRLEMMFLQVWLNQGCSCLILAWVTLRCRKWFCCFVWLQNLHVAWKQALRHTFRGLLNNLRRLGRNAPHLGLLTLHFLWILKVWLIVRLFFHFGEVADWWRLLANWVGADASQSCPALFLFKLSLRLRSMSRTALKNALVFGLVILGLLFHYFVRPFRQNRHIVNWISAFVPRLHLHSLCNNLCLCT
jgi:hypothetical protein